MRPTLEQLRSQLPGELAALGPEAMSIRALDGYLTGVLLSPTRIGCLDWLQVVVEPASVDLSQGGEQALELVTGLCAYMSALAERLRDDPDGYRPCLDGLADPGEAWRDWARGLREAVRFDVDGWFPGTDTTPWGMGATVLANLMAVEHGAECVPRAFVDLLETEPAEAIRAGVLMLHHAHAENGTLLTPREIEADVTRVLAESLEEGLAGELGPLDELDLKDLEGIDLRDPNLEDLGLDDLDDLDPGGSDLGGEPSPTAIHRPVRWAGSKVGRNDPCPCGSGKKYKKCCGA